MAYPVHDSTLGFRVSSLPAESLRPGALAKVERHHCGPAAERRVAPGGNSLV
jgi:hypothetical protein